MVDTARHFMPVDTVLLPHIRAMAINKVRISERRTASPPPPPVVCVARCVLCSQRACDVISHIVPLWL